MGRSHFSSRHLETARDRSDIKSCERGAVVGGHFIRDTAHVSTANSDEKVQCERGLRHRTQLVGQSVLGRTGIGSILSSDEFLKEATLLWRECKSQERHPCCHTERVRKLMLEERGGEWNSRVNLRGKEKCGVGGVGEVRGEMNRKERRGQLKPYNEV
ncbi:hypothetical protein Tco_0973997 [Tanacetum coccineum]|uniref:Uncharacterized protein n=1 Tax=Tanacetum coccineum TaxID=301880 RepID=A0ABQ5EAB9_9ASTR